MSVLQGDIADCDSAETALVRIVGTCVVVFSVLACTGCGPSPAPGDGEVVIEYWDFPRVGAVDAWQREQITQFQEKHSGVKVHLSRLPWQTGPQRLDVAVFSGNPPDIAGSVSNLIAYVEQGVVESWDPWLSDEEREDFYPSALEACSWQGKVWAMPWYKTAYVMLLNLNLFAQAGVEPPREHQWTWEEFVEKMQRLTLDRDGDGQPEQYGLGFNIAPEEFEAWAFLYTEGTEILSPDGRRCLFDSPATVRGVQKLYDLVHRYRVAPLRSGSLRHYQTWIHFNQEWRTAVTCQGIWAINAQRNSNREAARYDQEQLAQDQKDGPRRVMDFDVAMFPAPATGKPVLASSGVGNLVIFRQSNPEKLRLCVELVRRITTGEGQSILATYPLFPTRRSAGNLYEHDELLGAVLPYIGDAKVHPMHPEWVNIDKILSKELQLAVLGEKPIADAVRDGAQGVQVLLDRYYARQGSGN